MSSKDSDSGWVWLLDYDTKYTAKPSEKARQHRALDTGAGVLLSIWACRSSVEVLTYLPGHALIDGKIVSKPQLEPDPENSTVTMGDRVTALNKRLAEVSEEKAELAGKLDQSRILAESLQRNLTDLHREATEATKTIMKLEAKLAAIEAKGGLSVAPETPSGFLSLFRKS